MATELLLLLVVVACCLLRVVGCVLCFLPWTPLPQTSSPGPPYPGPPPHLLAPDHPKFVFGFSSPDPLFVLFFQFPKSFVELRWSLRVFHRGKISSQHTFGILWTSCEARAAPLSTWTAPTFCQAPHPDRLHPHRHLTTRQPTPVHFGGARAGARVGRKSFFLSVGHGRVFSSSKKGFVEVGPTLAETTAGEKRYLP